MSAASAHSSARTRGQHQRGNKGAGRGRGRVTGGKRVGGRPCDRNAGVVNDDERAAAGDQGFQGEIYGDVREQYGEADLPQQRPERRASHGGGGADDQPDEAAATDIAEGRHEDIGPRSMVRRGPRAQGGIEQEEAFEHGIRQ